MEDKKNGNQTPEIEDEELNQVAGGLNIPRDMRRPQQRVQPEPEEPKEIPQPLDSPW